MKTSVIIIFISLLLLASCGHHEEKESNSQEALAMIPGLMERAASHHLIAQDLKPIQEAIGDNAHAQEGLSEVKTLLEYNEYDHVMHALGFLDAILRTGAHPICPAHELAHYYVYMSHGDTDLAQSALTEAKEQMDEWKPIAKEYDEKYPGTVSYTEALGNINNHFSSIEHGNTEATYDEINFLANEGSLCVEGDHHESE